MFSFTFSFSPIVFALFLIPFSMFSASTVDGFSIKEATVEYIQIAFHNHKLTSRQLVEFYLEQIESLNPLLHGVIEVNPDALEEADRADEERKSNSRQEPMFGLHGIPILLKDNIATKDKLNTTAGSFALLGSVVPRDAGVVAKLRKAGAVILGKASLTEWANFRSYGSPDGWCARSGQGKNPYVLSADPCGSSSGSAISVAANMATVSLGTETDGSIICPSSYNAVVGVKPTVGLTSRAGVVPISPRQDTVGPICRTVADAVYVLDAIVGFDPYDPTTNKSSKYIPSGGYKQFLRTNGLQGKRLGIVRKPFFDFSSESVLPRAFENHFNTLRREGAILVDNLTIANIDEILSLGASSEETAMLAEFKLALNAYLKELVTSPVRSLADIIAFNNKFSKLEMTKEYGQDIFLKAEATSGIGHAEKKALSNLKKLTLRGFKKMMKKYKLDAMIAPGPDASSVLAIGGFPGISVPAAYDSKGIPVGICFGGLKGSEPKLIEIAYGFEQATKVRKVPEFLP
ncbi:Amidase signature domain [Dillenia turbinata]|uniref:Amidase signature domain n=1 Tax=Dillenia turbinata TaxID=194707 RepID=A0AAN8YWY6_9MAGN